ncbi:DNA modification methylase [candidate division WWE3 bacterium CG22_combo_CG10-13_8_21_14_all_39_12]|uniref:Methyltransferase n=1 Tax=candidate division WWE3 bacterium CG22_combo_CG10-13_8_21_14_all_39_12 TaxID=1975094 RepID=A0A2H0BF86_UNCKA|nr:MAG: DNA modification methylase [candidate division WWE3 bacterium CG22_combo_CG10-13_8_21_14_all_39_12]
MDINIGDIFQLGDHLLLCGDSLQQGQVERLLNGKSIDLVLTDPPYGVGYVENKSGFAKISNDTVIANDEEQSEDEYAIFTQGWIGSVLPYLNDKNTFYIFNSDKMIFALREGMRQAGVRFTQILIWIKNHAVIGRMDYLPQHEFIAYGWFGTHEFHKSKDKSILFYPKPNKSKLHPTMKPVGLLRRLILNSTKVGDAVYDPFEGSGSTLIACEQTKRRCLTIEVDPKYCQTIIDRFNKLTDKEVKRL